MKISRNQGDGESPVTYDLTNLDFDMLHIVTEGFRKKRRSIQQRKNTLNMVRFETHDPKQRKEIFQQIKYLDYLDKKLESAIQEILHMTTL